MRQQRFSMVLLVRSLKLATIPVFLGLLVWFSDIRDIYSVTLRSSPGALAGAFALSMIAVGLGALKWRLVIPAVGSLDLFKAALIGQFYSFFFLGQASGEAAKIYLLSRKSGNVSGATVSVLIDRLTSFIGLLAVSVFGLQLSSSNLPPSLQKTALMVLAALVAALIALRNNTLFRKAERVALWIESKTPGYSSAIAGGLRTAIQQWHSAVGNLWRVMAGASVGALVHIVNVLTLMVLALEISIKIDFADWCWIAGLISVAGLIPIAIGQMAAAGALVALLRLENVSTVDSVALSALVIAVNCLLALVGGLLEWRRLHAHIIPASSNMDSGSPP